MERSSTAAVVARGVAAGAVGTLVMTGFQKLVEMPITRRDDSFVPAKMAARLLGLQPDERSGWARLNYASHLTIGLTWGIALSAAERRGLSGQRRVAAVYGVIWNLDWLALVALGVDGPPWTWARRDLAIDAGEKLLLAEAAHATVDLLPLGRS